MAEQGFLFAEMQLHAGDVKGKIICGKKLYFQRRQKKNEYAEIVDLHQRRADYIHLKAPFL